MKKTFPVLAAVLYTTLLLAADSNPKDVLASAAKKLADQPNYSWKSTVEMPDQPTGTVEGKTEKDGATVLAMARGEQSFAGVLKGTKGAIKTDEGWKSLTEASDQSKGQTGANRFVARLLQNFRAPSTGVADLAAKAQDLKLADGVYSSLLSEEAVKELLMYRNRGGGGTSPEVNGAKGSIKFWIKDGSLSKYEYKVQGTFSFNGSDRDINRTHTTEIKDVGTTKVTVPDEAAKKL